MEHIAALLLIIGCSNDLAECRELPAPVPVFETAEDCDIERALSIRTFADANPRIFASCVPVDPALEEQDAELVWDIQDGKLIASIEVPDVMVASNSRANRDMSVTQE